MGEGKGSGKKGKGKDGGKGKDSSKGKHNPSWTVEEPVPWKGRIRRHHKPDVDGLVPEPKPAEDGRRIFRLAVLEREWAAVRRQRPYCVDDCPGRHVVCIG